MKTVLFVLLDMYSDWESAQLAPAITALGHRVQVVAPRGKTVRSLGGFATVPDSDIPPEAPEGCGGIVLVGGMSWRSSDAKQVESLVHSAVSRNLPTGAICDATVFLGKIGVLNGIAHTSNMLANLRAYAATNYSGDNLYRNEPAVRDGKIVTANGTASLDFAREMLIALEILEPEDAAKWYRLFKFGVYEAPEEAAWWFSLLKNR